MTGDEMTEKNLCICLASRHFSIEGPEILIIAATPISISELIAHSVTTAVVNENGRKKKSNKNGFYLKFVSDYRQWILGSPRVGEITACLLKQNVHRKEKPHIGADISQGPEAWPTSRPAWHYGRSRRWIDAIRWIFIHHEKGACGWYKYANRKYLQRQFNNPCLNVSGNCCRGESRTKGSSGGYHSATV